MRHLIIAGILFSCFVCGQARAARADLAIRVTLTEREMMRWYGEKIASAVSDGIARQLLADLLHRCPFEHWHLTTTPATSAMEFSVDDEAGDVVVRVTAVIAGNRKHTWSMVWQTQEIFTVPKADDAASQIAEAFERLLIRPRWVEIVRQIPLGGSSPGPRWVDDTRLVLPLDYNEHSDLSDALFQLDCGWSADGAGSQSRDIKILARGDGTQEYPGFPKYQAIAADSETVLYRNHSESFDVWRSKAHGFVFTGFVLYSPGELSNADH